MRPLTSLPRSIHIPIHKHNHTRRLLTPLQPPHHLRPITMSAPAATPTPDGAAKKASQIPKGKTELKILMLHGYTQSGPVFSSKTKALAKLLTKAVSPAPYNLHPTLLYPTAPHRLRPSDIPGYAPTGAGGATAEEEEEDDSDNWGWWRKDEATNTYRGVETCMQTIATAIAEAGGVDGVLGFSQGAALGALVAAALEEPLRTPTPDAEHHAPWLAQLRAANHGEPLKFCVVYSGFYAVPDDLQWLYSSPISTPTLHFLGSLDTVVEESRSQRLVERCVDPTVVVHPGGHYVPVAKDWVLVLIGWLRKQYEPKTTKKDDDDL
ncbi:serine hydrolase-domain-containing protein [Rostrohypoxylon terebratum]|nr:serine hydrolase-domain-containing protein [Rostrohypoxylon terebratum]